MTQPSSTALTFSLLTLPGVYPDLTSDFIRELEERGVEGEIVRLIHAPDESHDGEQQQPIREYTVGARWSPVRAAIFGLCLCQAQQVVLASGGIPITADLLAEMVQSAQSYPADVVIASRFSVGASPRYPLRQLLLSRLFRFASQRVVSSRINDPRSGLKLFPREALLLALGRVVERSSDLHLLPLTYFRRARIAEVPASVVAGDVRFPLSVRVLFNALNDLMKAAMHQR